MALMAKDGSLVSFECEDLISELRADLIEFGKDRPFAAWVRTDEEYGIEYISNYDFICEEFKILESQELREDERLVTMKGIEILAALEKQNAIV